MSFDYFGTLTNLVISFGVALYGAITWLPKKADQTTDNFKYRAYVCWWASWMAWVFAWALLLVLGWHNTNSMRYKVITLICDNLNSIFLIMAFLVITRGESFGWNKIRFAFKWTIGSYAVCLIILYSLSQSSPSVGVNFAYDVHKTWGLCLGVATPILLGWAFNLRFGTVLLLAIGFVYGFIQPIVYATELQVPGSDFNQTVAALQPVVAMTLAALKVTWAIAFMQVLTFGEASADSLVLERNATQSHPFKRWNQKVLGQVIVLCALYIVLSLSMVLYYENQYKNLLDHLATALGIVGGIIGLLDFLWTVWRRLWDKIEKKQQVIAD